MPASLLSCAALRAASDMLEGLGYGRERRKRDLEIAISRQEPRWPVNIVAFSDPICHIENACITVHDFRGSGLNSEETAKRLRHTTAPFHLLYDEQRNGFDFLTARPDEMRPLARNVAPDRLAECLEDYAADMKPACVQRVKRGLGTFTHKNLYDLQPLQLLLWAEEANCGLLTAHFKHALDVLASEGITDTEIRSKVAAQLLTARILTDTGAMPESTKVQDIPGAAENKHFEGYFDGPLLRRHSRAAQAAYDLFRNLSYATFQPEMLRTLYKKLFTKEESRAKGRFDTPLWLTRLIWRQIPVEFLSPDQRRVADLTCGWGSFLISAVERFSVLPDMKNRQLSRYIFGNDQDPVTAQLARIALLTSTGRDSWHVGHEDGRKWEMGTDKRPGIIVGNPPFAGNRKTQTTDSTGGSRKELANAFLARAVDLLADGGFLAMVMPGSFAVSESGPAVRKALLERCDIQEIWDIPGKIFDAGVQPMVIFAKKESGKARPSSHPVRIRNCQGSQEHLARLRSGGIFTRSSIYPSQEEWTKGRRSGKTTHVIGFPSILDLQEWRRIQRGCVPLESIAEVLSGCIKGSPKRARKTIDAPYKIRLLTKASSALRKEFVIDFAESEEVNYPNDLEWSRYESRDFLAGQKILVVSDPDPSWGKRIKLVIERKGYFPGGGFLSVVPAHGSGLGLELLAAILRWRVANGWLVENLRSRWVNTSVFRAIPIPKSLLESKAHHAEMRRLLLRLESAAHSGVHDEVTEASLGSLLEDAYRLGSSVSARLQAVYEWDSGGSDLPFFDTGANPLRADWIVQGKVESVDVTAQTLTLWISGFDERQLVPIVSQFPGWMLRPGAQFRTSIPKEEARRGRISGKSWGVIEPEHFTYLSDDELATRINERTRARQK